MEPRAVVALVTASGMDLIDLDQVPGRDSHPCPDPIAIRLHAAQLYLNPMIARDRLIAQDRGRGSRIEDHDIDSPIVVEVIERGSAANILAL